MTDTHDADTLDTQKTDHVALSKKWKAEISAAQRAQKKWIQRGEKVEKVYNDQRHLETDRKSRFNVLWSNVETLRPAVYLKTPKAQVGRRYRQRDAVARFVSELLQRCIQTGAEMWGFDNAIEQAVRDRLLPGRGQVWTFYEPQFDTDGNLVYEKAYSGYVPWKDFLHSVCRTWDENRWAARRFYKSRQEIRDWLKERRLKNWRELAEKVQLDCSPDGDRMDAGLKDDRAKAQIFEVWDRVSQKVCFIAPGSNEHAYLFSEPVPVLFEDFFPCPRPMLATTTSDSLIPTPDYAMYQDQARDLNDLTARISTLQQALGVKGIYDKSWEALAEFLDNSDNRMVPVENWAMLAEGGGAKNKVEWFPVEVVAATLQQLYQARDLAKQTLYEVSGISDIQRGATDPEETLGAQRIKAQWGTLRVRRVQKDVQRFCADALRLTGEVVAEVFRWDTILDMAGYDEDMLKQHMPPVQMPPEFAELKPQQQKLATAALQMEAEAAFLAEAEKMLRSEKRSFRIDVETDSTIEPDEAEERKARIEILTALGGFMQQAAVLVQQGPEGAKLAGDLILFGMRGFSKAGELEQTIENAAEAAARKAAEPRPDPEGEKIKIQAGELERKKQKDAADAKLGAGKLVLEKAKAGADVALEAGHMEADLQKQESADMHADADREERRNQMDGGGQ